MADHARRRVVVDGANVVGARPDGWWRDRAGAAARLHVRLRQLTERRDVDVVLVLEGAARAGVPESTADGITVVHARAEGDDEIVRQAGGIDRAADLVVTADRGLRQRVAPVPCTGPSWVWDEPEDG